MTVRAGGREWSAASEKAADDRHERGEGLEMREGEREGERDQDYGKTLPFDSDEASRLRPLHHSAKERAPQRLRSDTAHTG